MNRKNPDRAATFLKNLWNNYVFRNIVLFVSLLIIFLFVVSLLLNIVTRHNNQKAVPEFVGIPLNEAYLLAKKEGLRIEVNDSIYVPYLDPGVIIDQKPAAGFKVKSGRRIFVMVNAAHQRTVDVPYVAGYSLRQAKNILESAGFEIGKLVYVSDIATNNVLLQHINGKEVTDKKVVQAKAGSGVVLTVGRAYNAAPVTMPRLSGLSLREAKSLLWESGLNVGREIREKGINEKNIHNARIYRHSPESGTAVRLGSEVSLYLTLDSLAVAKGVSTSENRSRTFARHRVIVDSLANAGYSGDELRTEAEILVFSEKQGAGTDDIRANLNALLQAVEDERRAASISDIESEDNTVETEETDDFFDTLF